ncbi:NUDIX hydrolase [Microbacterium sp. gxy059]|uniref:NUDIX hydrolase n=1 Tax=Microbacterium sp. gxy059 TaxID=2957199 RepID=UPI003D998EC1
MGSSRSSNAKRKRPSRPDVYAAGGVMWRRVDGVLRILLVHRTKYRDVSLPKGKVDPGESLPETAVRELWEETGIRGHLGPSLGAVRFIMPSGRHKHVSYWAVEVDEDAVKASTFRPNKEISGIDWVTLDEARERLSYPVDGEILDAFERLVEAGGLGTFPIVLMRHGEAESPSAVDGPDSARPLTARGKEQARGAAGVLEAFGVRRIYASTARRCLQTVTPLSKRIGARIHETALISQDAWESGESDATAVIGKRVRKAKGAVLCSHGPVLPGLLDALALATGTVRSRELAERAALKTGSFTVVHVSRDAPGSGIVAIETHVARA